MLTTPSSHSSDGQGSNPYSRFFEDDNASLRERPLHLLKVREKKSQLLFWTPLRRAAEENHRRFSLFAEGEERSEISITGYNNTPLMLGAIEDRHVVGRLETIVTYMSGMRPG